MINPISKQYLNKRFFFRVNSHLPDSFDFVRLLSSHRSAKFHLMNNINLDPLLNLYAIVEYKLWPILMCLILIISYLPEPMVTLF